MLETFICSECGQQFPIAQREMFSDQALCPGCLESTTVICSDCGERIWRDDNAGTDSLPLCQECYDDYYTNCCDCGALIRNSDAYYRDSDEDEEYPYCSSCFHDLSSKEIKDYYYKPTPIFFGDGDRYFGVELEIDGAGESDNNARELMSIANDGPNRLYCKHDGSLDNGFELVTHPMTLDYHLNVMPWADIVSRAVEMHYLSHQAGTCGLHVHVSRAAFGDTEEEQDRVIARILYFFEKHWEELLKFSRRTQRQLEQWADRYGYKEQPHEILESAKRVGHSNRYSCVNLQNYDTVELRIFRGTLKLNTLLATLQMMDRICDVAVNLDDKELKNLSWTTFVAGCEQPELVQYLKERRLYVNEPVYVGGEI